MKKSWKLLLMMIGCVSCCFFAIEAKSETELPEAKLGDGHDGNRSTPTHLCELFTRVYADDEPEKVVLDSEEEAVQPFTTSDTCGKCHTYENISAGWHFNSSNADVPAGRPGEPWVLVDRFARTQIPVSGRGWQGTFKPEQVGLTPWQMVKNFGRHMPGGNYGEIIDQQDDGLDRMDVSGMFEINCLACHNADRRQNQSEAALQVARENLRWVPAAGSGLAVVSGLASSMDDFWDPREKAFSDNPSKMPPKVAYDKSRFDEKGRVFFDITRKVPANRCYFCHSVEHVSDETSDETLEPWEQDQDVHLAAGLSCVDCHRHGPNHMISRGYEDADTAVAEGKKATVASLTCAGCHLGSEEDRADSGRLGAPRPEHKGIPTVHFDKLTCTACHSGSKPAAKAGSVRTARIHWLGLHDKHHLDMYQPRIAATVMTKRQDGKIGPSRMIWPAFWARMKDDQVTPIEPGQVRKVAGDALKEGRSEKHLPEMSREQIAQVLTLLQGQCEKGQQAVYVGGGRLYRLDGDKVSDREHTAAQPYAWPLAHDVRPAQQSLGKSCDDCHTTDSPFFFGQVEVDTAVKDALGTTVAMHVFEQEDGTYWWLFNGSFLFRPMLKTVGFLISGLMALILLVYVVRALNRVLIFTSGRGPEAAADSTAATKACPWGFWGKLICGLIYLAAFGSIAVLALTGFWAFFVIGEPMSGYLLMLHCTAAPVFCFGIAALCVIWADKHRFLADDAKPGHRGVVKKACFWLVILMAIPVILSMVLSMVPLFGTTGQEFLYRLHQYSTLAFLICAIGLGYLTLARRNGCSKTNCP